MESLSQPESPENRVERVLNADQKLIQAVLDQMPSGVIVAEAPSGRVLFHNQEATRILKHPLVETKDASDYHEYGGIHEDGTPYASEEYPSYRALKGEVVYQEEVRYKAGNGEPIILSVNAGPVRDEQGAIIGTVISFYDITALKRATEALRESEGRFREMADNLPLIVWMHDATGAQEFVNNTFCEFFGVTRKQMIEDRWQILMHPEDAENYSNEFLAAVQNQTDFSAEVRVKRADGAWRWIRSWGKPRFGLNGEFLGIVGTSADITEQKAAEEVLERTNAELEAMVTERTATLQRQASRLRELSRQVAAAEHRERKRLGAMLHDELQQHLVAAKFKLFRAQRSDERAELLDAAMAMLDEALESSRNLTHELRPPVLYEDGLVPALRWLGREMGARHGKTIHVESSGVSGGFDDDARAFLYSSVQELLFNAVKHAGVGEIEVSLWEESGELLIEVADEGVGLDEEAVEGMDRGLGLFSVTERLEALGGSVEIASAPSRGTSILLRVPLDAESVEERTPGAAEEKTTPKQPSTGTGRATESEEPVRVLVVDDHAVARMGLVSLLEEEAEIAVVGQASDGMEAIEQIEGDAPDVVLMDLNMPRMNGIEATRRIRERWPSVHVVGLSVQDDDATIRSLLEAGAGAFVSKSESASRIKKVLFDLLRNN